VLIVILFFSPSLVSACACCSNPNIFFEYPEQIRNLGNIELDGTLGVWIYDESDGPEIDVAESDVSGTLSDKGIKFALTRNKLALGSLTLKFKEKPIHRRIGLDFILPREAPQNVEAKGNPGVYHEIVLKVRVEADEALKKSLGVTFARDGVVILHGNSNNCWEPSDGGRWSFQYSVSKGSIRERCMGRGDIPSESQPTAGR
jgi:hypothetical protein